MAHKTLDKHNSTQETWQSIEFASASLAWKMQCITTSYSRRPQSGSARIREGSTCQQHHAKHLTIERVCNCLQHVATPSGSSFFQVPGHNTLQHTATHCNTLQCLQNVTTPYSRRTPNSNARIREGNTWHTRHLTKYRVCKCLQLFITPYSRRPHMRATRRWYRGIHAWGGHDT